MNTATAIQTTTLSFEAERELRHAFVRAWRADPKQGASAHAAYAMIRGKSLNKTFSPIVNKNKLTHNSDNPYQGRDDAAAAAEAGARHAWAWAETVLKEAGIPQDRYGRHNLDQHPIIGAWIRAGMAEIARD